jgi:energy-coupling factor transporter ATP-binding protein EcfA2
MAEELQEIARYIHYNLPDPRYLRWVQRYLSHGETLSEDPFSILIPRDRVNDLYVDRYLISSPDDQDVNNPIDKQLAKTTIEKVVEDFQWCVIAGQPGIGKTTLVNHLVDLLREKQHAHRTLIVPIFISDITSNVPESDLNDGKISILTPERLSSKIFDVFWRKTIQNPYEGWEASRKDERWMRRLKCFYQHFNPQEANIGDFELKTWLEATTEACRLQARMSAEAILKELTTFIIEPPAVYRQRLPEEDWPFTRIQVLLDGTAHLSNRAVQRLIEDTQRLYTHFADIIDLKLFIDQIREQTLLKNMACIRDGHVPLYMIPFWTKSELQVMLSQRLVRYKDYMDKDKLLTWNWAKDLLSLKPSARRDLISIILSEAPKGRMQRFTDPFLTF